MLTYNIYLMWYVGKLTRLGVIRAEVIRTIVLEAWEYLRTSLAGATQRRRRTQKKVQQVPRKMGGAQRPLSWFCTAWQERNAC